jgi:hypothetical protein
MGTGLDGDNLAFIAVSCLTDRNLAVIEIENEISSTHYGIAPNSAAVGFRRPDREPTVLVTRWI